jgi:hypothetical protein
MFETGKSFLKAVLAAGRKFRQILICAFDRRYIFVNFEVK